MRKGGGKPKGNGYELQNAKLLSLWASNHQQQDIFARTSGSGNSATVLKRAGVDLDNYCGDICCVSPIGSVFARHFFIECKFYAKLEWERTLYGAEGVIGGFWKKCVREAVSFKKEPLLIAKENFKTDTMVTSELGYIILSKGGPLPLLATIPRFNMWVFFRRDFLMLNHRAIRNFLKYRAERNV